MTIPENRSNSKGPLPPLILLIALVLQVTSHLFLPFARLIPSPWNISGGVLILAGLALAVAADGQFKRAETTVRPFEQPRALVTKGMFAFTRNPMYLGMVVVLLGVGIALGTLTPLIMVPFFVLVIDIRFIRMEEAVLAECFGDEYRAYARRVRRWL